MYILLGFLCTKVSKLSTERLTNLPQVTKLGSEPAKYRMWVEKAWLEENNMLRP